MNLKIPKVIKKVTEQYITFNNYPLKFIKKYVRYVSGSFVHAAETYEMFKEWFRSKYPNKKVQDFEKFTKELTEEGYKINDDGIVIDVFISYNGEN